MCRASFGEGKVPGVVAGVAISCDKRHRVAELGIFEFAKALDIDAVNVVLDSKNGSDRGQDSNPFTRSISVKNFM